jgi:hypothetical protein
LWGEYLEEELDLLVLGGGVGAVGQFLELLGPGLGDQRKLSHLAGTENRKKRGRWW